MYFILSKKFCINNNLQYETIKKKTQRAKKKSLHHITINSKTYEFEYRSGVNGKDLWVDAIAKEDKENISNDVKGGIKTELKEKIQKEIFSEYKPLGHFSEKNVEEARKKEEFIHLFKELKVSVKDFLIVLKDLHNVKITAKTFWEWRKKYKKDGINGLLDTRDKANRKKRALNDWMQEFVLTQFRAYGSHGFNYAQAHRDLHREASRKGFLNYTAWLKNEEKNLCSEKSVKRFLDAYFKERPQEKILIEFGEDRFKSRVAPAFGKQDGNVSYKNELWQVDSSPLDIAVNENGRIFRPDIVSVVDVFSKRSVMMLCENSNSIALVRLMQKALRVLGKPKSVRGDNGKDYLSKNFQGMLKNLGIEFLRTPAYSGDKKAYVERMFKTIQHSHLKHSLGYI